MKAQLRSTALAVCLLAPVAATVCALPTAAFAQPAPEVQSLDIRADGPWQPGTRVRFRMEGTPNARAIVRVRGVRDSIPLREIDRGVYVGRYVIARDDDIDPGAPIRAILRIGNRTAVAEYNAPADVADSRAVPPAPPRGLPIEVVSHPNNGTIEGDVARVRGRTAPFAQVEVHVHASPPIFGQVGVGQDVLNDTLQADARGFFEFSFRTPYPVPGTKYDVDLVARKADESREARLTLFQRQG
ncbi:MAG TPA: hypothetical protein VL593_11585 [Ramlibacter sp.]|jgi:hypothetical protein|nr:hypothetical protein [Ramlibacter sp.]